MKKIKKHKRKLFPFFLLGLILLWANYIYISYNSNELIFENTNDIPKSEFALFLGTPKYLSDGSINNYYKNRIKSTINLYEKSKILKIIISADTLNKYKENEVEFIKSDLIKKGIPAADLILDTSGNRTWNSVTYLENYASSKKIILISILFHLERALNIAKAKIIN